MLFGPDNFLRKVQWLVTGDDGYLKDTPSILASPVSAAEQTALPVEAWVVPRDYDRHSNHLELHVAGRMDGATDTPAVTVTVTRTREGVTDEVLVSAEPLGSLTAAYQRFSLDLLGFDLQSGDHLAVAVTLGAHTTDDAERLSAVLTYRSTLVAYDEDERH